MADPVVTVTLTEFPTMKALGSFAKVKATLEKHYGRAARRVGMVLAAKMRKLIQAGTFAPNTPFTIGFKKGSSKPGAGLSGRLFKALTYRTSNENRTIEIGVLRSSESANVAKVFHDGAKITVTPRMHALFRAVIAAANGRGVVKSARGQELLSGLRDTGLNAPRVGTVLVIPPRPFALAVLVDPSTKALIEHEYTDALKSAMIELGK